MPASKARFAYGTGASGKVATGLATVVFAAVRAKCREVIASRRSCLAGTKKRWPATSDVSSVTHNASCAAHAVAALSPLKKASLKPMAWSLFRTWRQSKSAATVSLRRSSEHRRLSRTLAIDPLEQRQLLTFMSPPWPSRPRRFSAPATVVGRDLLQQFDLRRPQCGGQRCQRCRDRARQASIIAWAESVVCQLHQLRVGHQWNHDRCSRLARRAEH